MLTVSLRYQKYAIHLYKYLYFTKVNTAFLINHNSLLFMSLLNDNVHVDIKKTSKVSEKSQNPLPFKTFPCGLMWCSLVRIVDVEEHLLVCYPVLKERERERDGLHIAHTDDA